MNRIEAVLAREIGLSVQSIGDSALSSALAVRMTALGIETRQHYADHLALDPVERRALVEEIVVSETWFFRDEDMFRTLTRHVTSRRAARPSQPLRVLSIPCATGEEAYSVAIVLLEHGLGPRDFEIHAIDVSSRALAAAARASYGRNSFRGNSVDRWRHYFEAGSAGELRPVQSVREAAVFRQGNVLDTGAPWAASPFDVILCRNLLIYLDRESRSLALRNLKRWLADDGVLFAGHAETVDTMDAGFSRLHRSTHFAYVKRPSDPGATELGRQRHAPQRQARKPFPQGKPAQSARKAEHPEPPRPNAPASQDADLAAEQADLASALALADRGQLAEATSICERHLATHGASVEAYCLLGIVKQAAANAPSAMECFDKALYLDPSHYEALVHLALLHEQRGNRSRAEHLRRRAERVLAERNAR